MEKVMNTDQQLMFFEGVAASAMVNYKIQMSNPDAPQASPALIREEYQRDPLMQRTVQALKTAVMMMLTGELRLVVEPAAQPPLTGRN